MSLPKRVISTVGKSVCLAVALVAMSAPANAMKAERIRVAQAGASSNIQLADGHPERYVVVKGDTLWDISGKFLRDPWLWPEIWYVNPQVENPHLIYPGDVLTLVWVDGRPQLRLQRGETEKLSPRIRASALDNAIPTISYDAVAGFLARPGIISTEQLENAPYILSAKQNHLAAAAGMNVYVRGNKAPAGSDVYIINVGEELVDPDDGDLVGYEANYVAHGRVEQAGDPSSVLLLESHKEALKGDLIFNDPTEVPSHFIPHAPDSSVEGKVIAVAGGTTMAGQFMVVAFNRGSRNGIEPGHVLSVWKPGEVVRDTVKGGIGGGEKVQLPDEYAGRIMVFQVLDRISYGVIVNTVIEIEKLDAIRNP
jgi:hypothetical protein